METATKVVLGILTVAGVGAAIVLVPKKASAAPPQTPGGADAKPPVTLPPWVSTPPTWWTTPPAYSLPKSIPSVSSIPTDWVPPWAKAEAASKTPGTIADDYKTGYNAGFSDAAYSSDWGTSQNKGLYASSPSYKNGYDAGWAEYTSKVKTGASTGSEFVRVGGRMVPAARISHVGAPHPQPTGPRSQTPRATPASPASRTSPPARMQPASPSGRTPTARPPSITHQPGKTAQQPPSAPLFLRVTQAPMQLAKHSYDAVRGAMTAPKRFLFG